MGTLTINSEQRAFNHLLQRKFVCESVSVSFSSNEELDRLVVPDDWLKELQYHFSSSAPPA